MKNFLKIGKIIKPYGILGWNNIISFTEIPKKIFSYSPLFTKIKKKKIFIIIEKWRKYKKNFRIKINLTKNRDDANKLVNKFIYIKENQLPILPSSNYYWKDIIQCKIFNKKKLYIGTVTKILETKANDILVVQNKNDRTKNKSTLIPFIEKKIIKKVNIAKKRIKVDWS